MHPGASGARAIVASLLMCSVIACAGNRSAVHGDRILQQSIETYQRSLISRGVTGGSVAGVFRGDQTLAYSIVNSGLAGDTPISPHTIFPIWSMSKPITTAAMIKK